MKKLFALCVMSLVLSGCQTTSSSSTRLQIKQAYVNGVELPYIDEGRGVPVVFVHGSMTDHRIWEAERPLVAARYRFIAYNQRYFGSTPWRDDGRNFNQMTHASDLIAFIQSLKAGPVHVVSWSYGGSVATLAVSQHPELFRSLSIHEPTIGSLIVNTPEGKAAAGDFGKEVAQLRSVANGGDTLGATRQFWEFVVRLPAGGLDREPQALRQIVLDNARTVPLSLNAPPQPITCDMVRAIKVPVLITVGANTRPLWALAAQTMATCAQHGELVTIADSNHDAVVRQPTAFSRALLDFLAQH
ncbi:MAG: hypothetical protein NVSMB6_25610 [Burkholderiaceae bacterium]